MRECFQIEYNLYVLHCNTIICKEFECLPYEPMTTVSTMQTDILHLSFLMYVWNAMQYVTAHDRPLIAVYSETCNV